MRNREEHRLALRAPLIALLPETDVAAAVHWDGESFTPPASGDYLREQFAPGPPRLVGMYGSGHYETTGLYLLDYFAAAPGAAGGGTASAAGDAFADLIARTYHAGRQLTRGDGSRRVTVTILDVSSAKVIPDPPRLQTPVAVRWIAETPHSLT